MKKIFLIAITFIGISTYAQEINWMSFEEVQEAQKTTPKKVFIDAYTVWCGPCKMLDKNTFQNKAVAAYINENYYAVKFNAEGNEKIEFQGKTYENPQFNPNSSGRNSQHQLSAYFGVRAYPTMLFLDEDGNTITPVSGYLTPQQLEIYLKLIASNDYKSVTSQEAWDEYQSNFKSTFN